MIYTKSAPSLTGTWIKGSDIKSGIKAKLLVETTRRESQFKNEDGTPKLQDVSKVKFQGMEETYNIALNRATIDGLVDAFGSDSKNWVGPTLTAQTEKMIVGGRSVRALYLIPDGFQLAENEDGYMTIKPNEVSGTGSPKVEVSEDIAPEDIPF